MMSTKPVDEPCDPPLVSVVIPAFNASRTIERTLRSVMAQTYPNFEVIVVDDGSTDDTAAIVTSLSGLDARIFLVRKSNGGVASARNRGIREANGLYIAPLDADDVWLPENLSRQVTALAASKPETCFCFARSFSIDVFDNRREPAGSVHILAGDYVSLLRYNWVGNGSSAVFRRDAIVSIGGYDETLRTRGAQGAEDWKLILQLSARHPGIFIEDALVGYRAMPDSLSMDPVTMTRSIMAVIDEMRRCGPRIAPWHFWHARTNMHIYLFYRWLKRDLRAGALLCLVRAYVANPLWFAQENARDFLFTTVLPSAFRRLCRFFWLRPSSVV